MDVETVCTHDQLALELRGKLERLLPAEYGGDTSELRSSALSVVLASLAKRTPPIREGDLAVPAELRMAVVYTCAEELYREAITGPDSVHVIQWRHFRDRAANEVNTLMPTLTGGLRGAAYSGTMERR